MPKLVISYDRTADVLYISLGEPSPGIADEVSPGDFVRVDPHTNEIVGITLLDFCERFIHQNFADLPRWKPPAVIGEVCDE